MGVGPDVGPTQSLLDLKMCGIIRSEAIDGDRDSELEMADHPSRQRFERNLA